MQDVNVMKTEDYEFIFRNIHQQRYVRIKIRSKIRFDERIKHRREKEEEEERREGRTFTQENLHERESRNSHYTLMQRNTHYVRDTR